MENRTINPESPGKGRARHLAEASITLDQKKLNIFFEQLRLEQNLPMGISGGLLAMVIGAALWACITVATEFQIGYMAIAVGFLVGYAVRTGGKGIDKIFGITGALLSLSGCLLGNLFGIIGFIAEAEGLGYFETFNMIDFSLIPDIMIESFSPMDVIFYGVAIYQGYNFSFRKISQEEIINNAT